MRKLRPHGSGEGLASRGASLLYCRISYNRDKRGKRFVAGLICGFVDSILKVLVATTFSHSLTSPFILPIVLPTLFIFFYFLLFSSLVLSGLLLQGL